MFWETHGPYYGMHVYLLWFHLNQSEFKVFVLYCPDLSLYRNSVCLGVKHNELQATPLSYMHLNSHSIPPSTVAVHTDRSFTKTCIYNTVHRLQICGAP